MKYAIAGLGNQGEAVLRFLLEYTDNYIETYDIAKASKPAYRWLDDRDIHRWTHFRKSVFAFSFDGRGTMISCLPPELNPGLAIKCMLAGWNMVDLGGVLKYSLETLKKNNLAVQRKVSVIPDVGLAPGLPASVLKGWKDFGSRHIVTFCGGLVRKPKLPFGYSRSFDANGVIKECTGIAEVVRNGKLKLIPALSERRSVFVPRLGVLEASPTSGGTSFSARLLSGELDRFEYFTLRYPGHWDYLKENVLSQPNPAEVLTGITDTVSRSNPDLVVFGYELVDGSGGWMFWDYDHENEISAMAQATGYVAAAVATMVAENALPNGVLGMHDVSFPEVKHRVTSCMPNQFMEELP